MSGRSAIKLREEHAAIVRRVVPAPGLAALIEKDMARIALRDDDSLLHALTHAAQNLQRKKDPFDACLILFGLELVRERLGESVEAHRDLLPVARVMASVPVGRHNDAVYLAHRLYETLESHIARNQPNPWKAFAP
jgi:hypothetical protein